MNSSLPLEESTIPWYQIIFSKDMPQRRKKVPKKNLLMRPKAKLKELWQEGHSAEEIEVHEKC